MKEVTAALSNEEILDVAAEVISEMTPKEVVEYLGEIERAYVVSWYEIGVKLAELAEVKAGKLDLQYPTFKVANDIVTAILRHTQE